MSMFGGMGGSPMASMTVTNVGGNPLGGTGLESLLGSLGVRLPPQVPQTQTTNLNRPSTTQPQTNNPFQTPPTRR